MKKVEIILFCFNTCFIIILGLLLYLDVTISQVALSFKGCVESNQFVISIMDNSYLSFTLKFLPIFICFLLNLLSCLLFKGEIRVNFLTICGIYVMLSILIVSIVVIRNILAIFSVM